MGWFEVILLVVLLSLSESSSHWIVTENGKVTSQDGSPFSLIQSHNLVSLLEQEERLLQLHKLRKHLLNYKYQLTELMENLQSFKQSSNVLPTDCNTNTNRLKNFVTGSTVIPLEDKGISHHDYLDPAATSSKPICSHFSTVPFFMNNFAHLSSIQSKDSIVGSSEMLLLLPFYLQLNEFGNSVHQGLDKNKTSWVLYNLAAIYWRARGDPSQAIDCIQRALYYSPSQYHDIPLLHLTNVLLYSGRYDDALVPLKTALSFSPSKGILYYTLGHIYTKLGFLSEAVLAFDTALYYGYHKNSALALRDHYYCQIKSNNIIHTTIDKVIDVKNRLLKLYHTLAKASQQVKIADVNKEMSKWLDLMSNTSPITYSSLSPYDTISCNHSLPTDIMLLLACAVYDISMMESNSINFTNPVLAVEMELKKLKQSQMDAKPKIHLYHKGNCRHVHFKKNKTSITSEVLSLFYPHPTCKANHTEKNSSKSSKRPSRYTEAYRQMEFLPYTSLSPSLDELIFTNKSSTVDYHNPSWPNKAHCLELVENLSQDLPRFTGTFLTPESRGVRFNDLLTLLPLPWQREPICSNVTMLPYSMSAFDHLMGVANRDQLSNGDNVSEAALLQLLVSIVEKATGVHYTVEGAAERITASLYKYSTHWGLYNLASVYWRGIGNGVESVECLRRAVHYADPRYRDIGFIGLANVLHRHGYLDSAMVVARAALDMGVDSPIGHYTLAGIYLTNGNLVATNLHLRMALHLQPHFTHAYSALKLVRCSLKFKEEQKLLEQKQQLLQAQQELIRRRREPTASNLQEVLQQIVKQKEKTKQVNVAEDEAIQYLANLVSVMTHNKSQIMSSSSTLRPSSVMQHTSSEELHPSAPPKPKYTMELIAKENEREEELRKRWPDNLPWPTLEDCKRKPPPQFMVFTSTWLSVTAKKINITDYMDFNSSIDGYSLLPICELDFELSSVTLNHLQGMNKPPLLDYIAERGLEEVLCKLSGSFTPMEDMATRMKLAMMKNTSNWVVSNLAALYWRIVGDGQQSLKCLKHALHYAPSHNKDVAYVSIANVLYRSGYYEDAGTAMQLALETSPNLVVNHFTMANILAAQSFYHEAAGYYELVLYHQPEFGPASERLRASRCMIILGRNKIKLKDLHENK
jgi:tetratricopeptide (TPR) repeat protein